MAVEQWSGRSRGIRCVLAIAAAVLLGGVGQLVPAAPGQSLAAATVGPQATPWPYALPQARRVKDLAPGSLLVAARTLIDPNFFQTVVMLIDHTEEGTAGLVVNRQTDVPLSRVFQKLPQAQRQSGLLHLGGPVSTNAVQALVRSPAPVAHGRHVADDVHVLGTPQGLEEKLATTTDASRFRVYMGYAGWAPGQLEQEVGGGAWHILPADADVVFDPNPDAVWQRQIRRTEGILARKASAGGPQRHDQARQDVVVRRARPSGREVDALPGLCANPDMTGQSAHLTSK